MGQLEERSGVSKSVISRIETSKRVGVHARTWQALSEALGVRPEDLADMERRPAPAYHLDLEEYLDIKNRDGIPPTDHDLAVIAEYLAKWQREKAEKARRGQREKERSE